MRAQDWSRFLVESSLSSSPILSPSLYPPSCWCSPVTLPQLIWYVCVPSGAAGRAKSPNSGPRSRCPSVVQSWVQCVRVCSGFGSCFETGVAWKRARLGQCHNLSTIAGHRSTNRVTADFPRHRRRSPTASPPHAAQLRSTLNDFQRSNDSERSQALAFQTAFTAAR